MATSHYESLIGLAGRFGKAAMEEVNPADMDSEGSKDLTELWATAQVLAILAASLEKGEVCSLFSGLLAESWNAQIEADPELRQWLKFDDLGNAEVNEN